MENRSCSFCITNFDFKQVRGKNASTSAIIQSIPNHITVFDTNRKSKNKQTMVNLVFGLKNWTLFRFYVALHCAGLLFQFLCDQWASFQPVENFLYFWQKLHAEWYHWRHIIPALVLHNKEYLQLLRVRMAKWVAQELRWGWIDHESILLPWDLKISPHCLVQWHFIWATIRLLSSIFASTLVFNT